MRVTVICAVAVHLAITLPAAYAQAGSAVAQRLPACLSCHGEDGQSQTPDVPSLGGQPAPYTLIQLFMFRERLRVAPPMNEDTKGWSDEDLQSMSIALSKLPPHGRSAEKGDPQMRAAARSPSKTTAISAIDPILPDRKTCHGSQTSARITSSRR